MTRLPINYQNTIIYKLVCNDPTIIDIYVGHTTDVIRRKWQHKTACNNENTRKYNYYVYQFIRNNGGFENWSIVQIELYPCNNTHEATARERYWLEQLSATLNTNIPSRTPQEYREANKEEILETRKEYYQANREQIRESQKEYYEANREIIIEKQKKYQKENKEIISEYHIEYNEINREIINEKSKEYYQKNKDRINEKNKEKITCECGCIVRKSDLAKHRKTKKHLNFFE